MACTGKRKKWVLRKQDPNLARELAQALGISPVVAQILVNRGIMTVEAGQQFFQCDLADLPDPFLMLGMDRAVNRIKRAFEQGESIVIYGDYDADGQTATALLVRCFRELAPNPAAINYYLPDRFDEGYGLNRDALTRLSDRASLLVTVDCGISSVMDVSYAQERGLDVIITDHHEPGPELPPAIAILNPKQEGCPYPFKQLAGVGVACKLSQALGAPNWIELLDLVALGTVADLVPLEQENRTLVFHGLSRLAQRTNTGLKALLEVAGVAEPTASDLGFRLGPRLNAAGRLGDPSRGVRLLLTEDVAEARELASELHLENSARQDLEAEVLRDAIQIVEKYGLDRRNALVVWGEGWHQGVVGIVASRLVERYYLPTVVISINEDQGTASARSIPGLDLYQTLSDCASLLSRFGGHAMAAGLSLPVSNLLAFQQLFERLCAERISPDDYIPKLYIDDTISLNQVSETFIEELKALEPHGFGNPAPLIQAEVAILRSNQVGPQNNHLQLTVRDETTEEMAAIAFGFGDQQEKVEKHAERVALAFVPGVNEWRRQRNLQLTVKEWEPRGSSHGYVKRWMVDLYPWRLGAVYYQSRALQLEGGRVMKPKALRWVDLRGTWDKAGVLVASRAAAEQEPLLILVNTPASVLKVCRELRIKVARGDQLIGFEHEWLTEGEREEFLRSPFPWTVSTGFGLESASWRSIWFWEPPLTRETGELWSTLCLDGGEVVGLFGPKDVRQLQADLVQNYPDRNGLARIYGNLKGEGCQISLKEAYDRLDRLGLVGALPVAMGVFSELGLWQLDENRILYSEVPAQKLDLQHSVLYNKVIKIRQQSAQYLKRCLERGFFQDELKREN